MLLLLRQAIQCRSIGRRFGFTAQASGRRDPACARRPAGERLYRHRRTPCSACSQSWSRWSSRSGRHRSTACSGRARSRRPRSAGRAQIGGSRCPVCGERACASQRGLMRVSIPVCGGGAAALLACPRPTRHSCSLRHRAAASHARCRRCRSAPRWGLPVALHKLVYPRALKG